jgi:hypothetical protein
MRSSPDEHYWIWSMLVVSHVQLRKGERMNHTKMTKEEQLEWYDRSHKNWRAWGSWFSWGSPVGLGLFFISAAATLWILSQAFGWN